MARKPKRLSGRYNVMWTYTPFAGKPYAGKPEEVPEEFDKYAFEGSVDEIIQRLTELKTKYPDKVLWLEHDVYYQPYDETPTTRYLVKEEREENDAEYNARLAKDAERKAQWEAADLAKLAELKKRYPDA